MADLDIDHSGLREVANAVRHDSSGLPTAHKRKRDSDVGEMSRLMKRASPNTGAMDQSTGGPSLEALQDYSNTMHHAANEPEEHVNNASDTANAALALYPGISIPARTEDSFANQPSAGESNSDYPLNDGSGQDQSFLDDGSPSNTGRSGPKPAVGSDEWHKVRKDNHKEVERRRRETINEGINELAKIVPGCEKNKGSILQRAVSFIVQLKDNETQNIEKWTLEKLLTEQAIAELSASNDKLKAENERAWREVETWKKACQSAGLAPKKDPTGAD